MAKYSTALEYVTFSYLIKMVGVTCY